MLQIYITGVFVSVHIFYLGARDFYSLTFLCAKVIHSEAENTLWSTSDWISPARKIVNILKVLTRLGSLL